MGLRIWAKISDYVRNKMKMDYDLEGTTGSRKYCFTISFYKDEIYEFGLEIFILIKNLPKHSERGPSMVVH